MIGFYIMKHKHQMFFSAFILLVMTAIIFLGLISGIRLCSVVSGSMEPNLPTWSLCVINTRASYDSIQTGDIVVYYRRSDDMRIIHRVIEITPDGMITKGDANQTSDGLSIGRDNLFGKSLFHIPYLGYCSKLAETPTAKVAMFACMTIIMAMDFAETRKCKKEKC